MWVHEPQPPAERLSHLLGPAPGRPRGGSQAGPATEQSLIIPYWTSETMPWVGLWLLTGCLIRYTKLISHILKVLYYQRSALAPVRGKGWEWMVGGEAGLALFLFLRSQLGLLWRTLLTVIFPSVLSEFSCTLQAFMIIPYSVVLLFSFHVVSLVADFCKPCPGTWHIKERA